MIDSLDPILAGLTPPQAEAAMHDGAILVLAGAGTGKTRTLADDLDAMELLSAILTPAASPQSRK